MLKESPQDLVHDDHFNSLVPETAVNRRGFIGAVDDIKDLRVSQVLDALDEMLGLGAGARGGHGQTLTRIDQHRVLSPADAANYPAFLEASRLIHENAVLSAGRQAFENPLPFTRTTPGWRMPATASTSCSKRTRRSTDEHDEADR